MSEERSASAAGTVAADDPETLAALLVAAEQRLAVVPDLEARIAGLERDLSDTQAALAGAREEVLRLDQMLMYGRRALRFVRPLIVPLRNARRRMHG